MFRFINFLSSKILVCISMLLAAQLSWAACGSTCTQCVLETRTDILPFYQSNGWNTSCGYRNAIVDNWCTIDPSGCDEVKTGTCAQSCGAPPPTCGTECTQCTLANRTDILPFYAANGWNTSCGYHNAIVDNWCTIDPSGCSQVQSGACNQSCGGTTTCGTDCTQCLLSNRTDILPFYAANGWDTSCPHHDAITDNWCLIDPQGCAEAKTSFCASSCQVVTPCNPTVTGAEHGAVNLPNDFDAGWPFPSGEQVYIAAAYEQTGSNLHDKYTEQYSNNDGYALDMTLPQHNNNGYGQNVLAMQSGVVVESKTALGGWDNYGEVVIIRHDYNADGHTYYSLYAHLASRSVSANDVVTKGQAIGTLGDSTSAGNAGMGAHLHIAFYQDALHNFGFVYGGRAAVPEPLGCTGSFQAFQNYTAD